MWTVKEILDATKGRLLSGNEEDILTGVSTDTRRMKGGELFLAIKGDRFDGHNFILDSVSRAARAVLIQRDCIANANFNIPGVSVISVSNSVKALGDIAHYHRKRFDIPVIAVTGSNGKTTTKEMISAILSKKMNVLKNFGTENNHIGVPFTLLRLDPSYNIAVLEMGTNHLGEIRRLSEIAKPSEVVITNIGPSHLEYLRDTRTVMQAKCEILEFLDKDGKVVINADDESLKKLKTEFKMVRFGLSKRYDFYAEEIDVEPDSISFKLNGKWDINLGLIGRHNVYNVLCAISAAWDFGVTIDEIKDVLQGFRVPNMRMEVKRIGELRIINDTYNSNPLSMKQAIEVLRDVTTKGRKILIAGDMLELGSFSSRFHHLVGRQAAESGIDLLLAVGRQAEHIVNGAQEAGMAAKKIHCCSLTKEACGLVSNLIKAGDTVLVKGSRAMKMEEIVAEIEALYRT